MDQICNIKLKAIRASDELEEQFWRAVISIAERQCPPFLSYGGHRAHIVDAQVDWAASHHENVTARNGSILARISASGRNWQRATEQRDVLGLVSEMSNGFFQWLTFVTRRLIGNLYRLEKCFRLRQHREGLPRDSCMPSLPPKMLKLEIFRSTSVSQRQSDSQSHERFIPAHRPQEKQVAFSAALAPTTQESSNLRWPI
jgi:hypothetical protein